MLQSEDILQSIRGHFLSVYCRLGLKPHATSLQSTETRKAVGRGLGNNGLWFVVNGAASDWIIVIYSHWWADRAPSATVCSAIIYQPITSRQACWWWNYTFNETWRIASILSFFPKLFFSSFRFIVAREWFSAALLYSFHPLVGDLLLAYSLTFFSHEAVGLRCLAVLVRACLAVWLPSLRQWGEKYMMSYCTCSL